MYEFPLGQCDVAKYHEWRVMWSDTEAQKERCTFCKTIMVWRFFENGRMANQRDYYEAHIRDFAQPSGRTADVYRELYGFAPVKKELIRLENEANRQNKMDALDRARIAYLKQGEGNKVFV